MAPVGVPEDRGAYVKLFYENCCLTKNRCTTFLMVCDDNYRPVKSISVWRSFEALNLFVSKAKQFIAETTSIQPSDGEISSIILPTDIKFALDFYGCVGIIKSFDDPVEAIQAQAKEWLRKYLLDTNYPLPGSYKIMYES